jgi:hypothetical protein
MRCATLVLMAIVVAGSVAVGQDLAPSKVPAVVRQALRAKFPDVRQVAWKQKSGTYDAEFTVNKAEITVKFDASGKWQETESAIPGAKVPAAVNDTMAKRFGGYKVVETQDMRRADDPRLRYEIHLENAKEIVKAQFYADGTIISQSAKPKTPAKK